MPGLSALLTIRREVGLSEFSFTYTDWSQNISSSWVGNLTTSETAVLEKELRSFSSHPGPGAIETIRLILNQFFPEGQLALFENNPPESLVILSDEATLPWEWVGLHTPLLARTAVTRELASRPSTTPIGSGQRVFCLLGDPLSSRAGAEEDVRTAAGQLRDADVRITTSVDGTTRDLASDSLYGDRFSMVHLACPGLLPIEIGGQVFTPTLEEGARLCAPRFVFFHLYSRPDTPSEPLFAPLLEWARTLFARGVECLLANLWSASPTDQRKFTRHFYTRLVEGASIGQAVRETRLMLLERGSALAYAYYCYGNPSLTLGDLCPVRVRESTTMPGGLTTDFSLVITNGEEEGRTIPLFTAALHQRGLVLGSAGMRPCDIELHDSLPNQTAMLSIRGQTLILANLKGDPALVKVNGLPVAAEIALSGWETLDLGPVRLKVTRSAASQAEAEHQSLEAFCLEIQDSQETRTEWYDDDLVTLGRGSSSRISFCDPSVSRNHAVLQRSGGSLLLSRLGSNMVAVNGVPVEHIHNLHDGDLVQLADRASFRVLRILGSESE